MKLSPQRVRQLVEIAYTIEPLLDKKDCTTRYKDLPNRPLEDFIIAGINVGYVFEKYANSVINEGNRQIFSHFPEAVKVSNDYKRKKYINEGLLEFMFVFVKTRLKYPTKKDVCKNIIPSIKDTDHQDVIDNLKGFRLAIKTSNNQYKKQHAKDNYAYFAKSKNIYELYQRVLEKFPDKTKSGHQVSQQYLNGFPIVDKYLNEVSEKKGLIKSIENTFNKLHRKDKDLKVGILADLAAVAIFIHLSYQKPTYIIK